MTTRETGVGRRESGVLRLRSGRVARWLLAAGFILLVAASPAFAQKKPVKKGLVWDDRPSIVFSKNIHIDLRMKLQTDWRQFDPEINRDLFDFRNLRFGVKGEFTKHFDFEVEREVDTTEWQCGRLEGRLRQLEDLRRRRRCRAGGSRCPSAWSS